MRAILLLCFVLSGLPPALLPGRQSPDRAISTYRSIVDDYRRVGSVAVDAVVALADREISAALDALLAQRDDAAWTWEDVRAAAILHTEAVAIGFKERQDRLAKTHLDAVVRLASELPRRRPDQKDFVYRLQIFIGALSRQVGATAIVDSALWRLRQTNYLQPFEEEARRRFNEGVKWELQGALQGVALSAQPMYSLGDNPGLPTRFWLPAAREYLAAIATDKTLLQAHLHLGRVRMLEGKLDEALGLFENAKKAVDPRVRYLAFLFAGSILERRSQFAEAEQQYRQGIAEYPWGQSGHLALAEVLSRTGRDGEARATLLARFNGVQRIAEPLWTYAFARPEDQLAALFDELRVEVGK